MRFKCDGSELSVGDFDPLRVFLVDQLCGHVQPGVGGGGTDVVEDRLIAAQRVAGPVLADLAEQAMVDVLELLVAVCAGACRDALVVDAQPVVEVLEDAGDGPGTDLDVEGGEFCSDLLGGAADPTDTGDGVAGDIVLQCRFDGSDHLGRFFSRRGRPPSGRRTRSRSTSWASSCLRPRATVPGSIPSNPAIRASPPQPHLRDSRPAYSRR